MRLISGSGVSSDVGWICDCAYGVWNRPAGAKISITAVTFDMFGYDLVNTFPDSIGIRDQLKLDTAPTVKLFGKGRKIRNVPLQADE